MRNRLFPVCLCQKTEVSKDLELAFYELVDPTVSVFGNKNNPGQVRESWSAAGMVVSADGAL